MNSSESGEAKSIWSVYSAAPHRVMFLAGAIQLVLTILFWAVELSGRYTELSIEPALSIPATWAHVYLMLFGIFPFFTFGFLMTTYPKWMNGEPIPASGYLPSFFLMAAGSALFYAGLFSLQVLVIVGIVLHIFGWALGYNSLIGVFMAVKGADRYHAGHLNVALASGIAGELAFLIFIINGAYLFFDLAIQLSFWLYIVPMLVIVAHRMIPFFSGNVVENYTLYRPRWILYLFWILMAGSAVFSLLDISSMRLVFRAALIALTFFLTLKWGLFRSFKVRLLCVLHVAFLWFSIGMALYVVQDLWELVKGDFILGKSPLHAMAIGFVTSMVIAMGTRVSLGHSGRELVMDTFSWICFWGVQLSALLRISAELDSLSALSPLNLNLAASIAWLIFIIPWAFKYGLMYLRPRIDGKPG